MKAGRFKLGIRGKILLVSLALITTSVAIADLYLTHLLDGAMIERVRKDLVVRLRLIERDAATSQLDIEDRETWDALADELGRRAEGRVTLARTNGEVMGDSELSGQALLSIGSHADRPELVQALRNGEGAATRFSDTLGHRMLYVAVPFSQAGKPIGLARLAVPLTEVDDAIARVRRLVYLASALGLGFALFMSTLVAHLVSTSMRSLTQAARRMAGGDLDARTRVVGNDEISELGKALDHLAESLKAALDELRSERDRMKRVLGSMPEGVLLLDREFRAQLANPALQQLLQLKDDVVGKSPLEILRNAELASLLGRAEREQGSVSGEIELGAASPRQLLVQATHLADDTGGTLVVFVDVTNLRRLESMRSDFVANVSHELRTPIAAVGSAAETLRRAIETRPEAALDFIEIIERNASRLHRLVEDLLDLSKIESREFSMAPEPVELRAAVIHVLSLLGTSADLKSTTLMVSIGEDLPPVLADRRALEQVLTNLIENALKYGRPKGTVELKALVHAGCLRLSVSDDGPGIEPKHLPRLFERFYRVDAGRSRAIGGTGLGLAIVKHLAEAMGGSVSVESHLGAGSTFSVTLPIA